VDGRVVVGSDRYWMFYELLPYKFSSQVAWKFVGEFKILEGEGQAHMMIP
jgi:hypothetical protein